jgi:uncharacterized membrane protein
MTQEVYLKRLRASLKKMPADRANEICEDIRLHFTEAVQAGESPEAISEALGEPETLAKEYRATEAAQTAYRHSTVGNAMRAVWAGIGLGMLNLMIVLPIVASLFACWVGFMASGISMAVSGAVAVLVILLNFLVPLSFVFVEYPLFFLFACIAICGLGILLSIGMVYAGKWMLRVLIGYVKGNIDIIVGRRQAHGESK